MFKEFIRELRLIFFNDSNYKMKPPNLKNKFYRLMYSLCNFSRHFLVYIQYSNLNRFKKSKLKLSIFKYINDLVMYLQFTGCPYYYSKWQDQEKLRIESWKKEIVYDEIIESDSYTASLIDQSTNILRSFTEKQ